MSDGLKVARIDHAGDDREIIAVYTYTGDDVDVDVVASLDPLDQWKQPVRVASTADIDLATVADADTIDGVTLAVGDRLLAKDQAAPEENGIYTVGASAGDTERAPDMDEDDEVLGALVYVVAGTSNAGKVFRVDLATAPTIGTDAIDWVELAGGSSSANDTSLNTVAAAGSTETLDVSVARTHEVTLTADCDVTLAGWGTGAWYATLWFTEDATGGWTPTLLGATWMDGSPPAWDTAANQRFGVTVYSADGGTTVYAIPIGGAGGSSVPDGTDPGDLLIWDGAAWDVLPVGSDDQVLTADSGEALGAKWAAAAAAAGGHYELLMTGSSPPEPIEDGTGTDWLWVWVND